MNMCLARIVLTLTCLVAPACLGVGDRAVAGVITLEKASEFSMDPMASMPSGGSAPAWDLFGRITNRFFECAICATEIDSDDDGCLRGGVPGVLAKPLGAIGRSSRADGSGSRPTPPEHDPVAGALLPVSNSPLLVHQNHRRIHLSDKVSTDPVLNDLSQPPRW